MLFHISMIALAIACSLILVPYFRRERRREMAMEIERDFYQE